MKKIWQEYALNWRNGQFRRAAADQTRQAVSFAQATSVGILARLSGHDADEFKALRKFFEDLRATGKQVRALVYFDEVPADTNVFHYPFFTTDDLTWQGTFESEDIDAFLAEPFDYLYDLSLTPFPPFEQLLLRTPARCRVGRYAEGCDHLYDLMIHLKDADGPAVLPAQMLRVSNAIQNP